MSREDELDQLARTYLRTEDLSLADALMEELAVERTLPLLEKIVSSKLGRFSHTSQDVGDVCGEAMLALIGKLEEWRSTGEEPQSNFDGYVATTAYHACDEYFRRRFPQRHRLKNRLRYLLKQERGFELWRYESGESVCGRTGWRTRRLPVCRPGAIETVSLSHAADLEQFLSTLFDSLGGPVEFDDVVTLAARALGITDRQVNIAPLPAPVTWDLESWRGRALRVWQEIQALPLEQRTALLLNLRGENETCAIALFPVTGVASVAEIAVALEYPLLEFAELWNRLPVGDEEIARRLGLKRQQVINLRLSARRKLERSRKQSRE